MKKVFASLALVLVVVLSCAVFVGCANQNVQVEGTYKLYSRGDKGLGDDDYGLILDEDCDVLVLNADGTYQETVKTHFGTDVTEVYTGTWAHKEGNVYTLTVIARNGANLDEPYTEDFTIENGVATFDDHGYIIILHKV